MYFLQKGIIACCAAALLLWGCNTKKELVYFQGKPTEFASNSSYNPTIKPDDLLSILVMANDEKSTVLFNLPQALGNNLYGGYAQGAPTPPGYLVNSEGNIEFPVIGTIHLAGLTRTQAIDVLKEKLGSYIVNPTISLRILNFRVTVLGDVRNPGTFTIPNERITLLEALGIAGDLLITGERHNVLVIRDEDGKRKEYRLDLTQESLFSSPVFYLQQNDVIYVEPNRAKRNSSVINASNTGIVISSLSLVLTTLILIFK
jgi:polysaccharide export outer membrane protein